MGLNRQTDNWQKDKRAFGNHTPHGITYVENNQLTMRGDHAVLQVCDGRNQGVREYTSEKRFRLLKCLSRI